MTTGQRIKQRRKELKLTQKELDERTGVSNTYISDIERDVVNPSLKTIESLAKGLETSASKLVDDGHGGSCEECMFSSQDNDGYLECHRYPPILQYKQEYSEYVSEWVRPLVNRNEWCGEYKPKGDNQ